MADIHGSCDERFAAVRDALARNLDSGEELGASLVVDVDGDIAVDLWGGSDRSAAYGQAIFDAVTR